MVAGAQKRGDGKMHRRHATRRAHGADPLLERRQPLLEHRRRRVGDARVDVAGTLEVEQPGGMIGVVEQIRRGLVDRHRARARYRIGMLPGMQAQGLEGGRLGRGHCVLVGGDRGRTAAACWHRMRRLPICHSEQPAAACSPDEAKRNPGWDSQVANARVAFFEGALFLYHEPTGPVMSKNR
jgi:hypothetical protein